MHRWIAPCEKRVLFATVPAGFSDAAFGAAISNGTAMEFAPDGRLFVAQETGQLRIITTAGNLLAAPAITVTTDPTGERGLLGIAFDPNFASNQYIYLYYTATTPAIHNRISRFTMTGDTTTAATELVLMDLPNLSATNHNGGAMHFGIDGKLYVAVGENAVAANAQSNSTTLGKMLRLNSDGSIPTDNPFYGSTTGNNRAIWARGLRNPFTFAVQPVTGKIAINDVGQTSWEEVNIGLAGANYGWNATEGDFTQGSFPAFTRPRYSYDRAQGQFIAGGTFYNPGIANPYPNALVGRYFLADGGSGWIKHINPDGAPTANDAASFASGLSVPVDLKTGPDGFIYYLQRGTGNGSAGVRRITTTPVTNTAPQFMIDGTSPGSQTVQIVFNRDIAGSPAAGDLIITNLDTNVAISSADISVQYTAATRTATWFYTGNAAGIFPDGNYRATLPAGAVDDANDIPTTQASQVDFFILDGDATRDRIVDTQDFNLLAANFGNTAAFTQGNFDYSGTVDSIDFGRLLNNFGKRLLPPAGPVLGALVVAGGQLINPPFGDSPLRPYRDLPEFLS